MSNDSNTKKKPIHNPDITPEITSKLPPEHLKVANVTTMSAEEAKKIFGENLEKLDGNSMVGGISLDITDPDALLVAYDKLRNAGLSNSNIMEILVVVAQKQGDVMGDPEKARKTFESVHREASQFKGYDTQMDVEQMNEWFKENMGKKDMPYTLVKAVRQTLEEAKKATLSPKEAIDIHEQLYIKTNPFSPERCAKRIEDLKEILNLATSLDKLSGNNPARIRDVVASNSEYYQNYLDVFKRLNPILWDFMMHIEKNYGVNSESSAREVMRSLGLNAIADDPHLVGVGCVMRNEQTGKYGIVTKTPTCLQHGTLEITECEDAKGTRPDMDKISKFTGSQEMTESGYVCVHDPRLVPPPGSGTATDFSNGHATDDIEADGQMRIKLPEGASTSKH